MKARLIIVCLYCCLTWTSVPAWATHIVGGEVTYTCVGNNTYNVAITIYEDCLNGSAKAIASDDPAVFKVFDGNGVPLSIYHGDYQEDTAYFLPDDDILVPANFSNSCITNPPQLCLRRKTFRKQYYLPPNTSGYMVVYQRCCRNAAVINLVDPSNIGATYYCVIPPVSEAPCNNSAVYKNYPPQIICINNPLFYDNSATDADGDSLSYELCGAYLGGKSGDNNIIIDPPPYTPAPYVAPFSSQFPVASNPALQIDPVTGLITGTPTMVGRYVVTVCCLEWRNGVNINTVKREFQFVVTDCSRTVIADMPQFSTQPNTYIVDCKDSTVHFINTSKGGQTYSWNFGFPGGTSTDFEPTIQYPDTGTYMVTLAVNEGSTCSDSISKLVKIYPVFKAGYTVTGLQCPGSVITFTDKTNATYKPISNWLYKFGDGSVSDSENTTHIYTQQGLYYVTLSTGNAKGCADTSMKQLLIDDFTPFAGNDTTIIKGQQVFFNATGGDQYSWTPATHLSDIAVADPVGFYPDTGIFNYHVHVVSAVGCQGDASVKVYVVNNTEFFIPTAFTPNGDGLNDMFKPTTVGYRAINFFRIYNRWGQLIYDAHSLETGWDGTYGGKPVDVGVYYWLLSMVDYTGTTKSFKGNVTVVR